MLSVALEHKTGIVATLEIANERAGGSMNITEEDRTNAAFIPGILQPRQVVRIMKGDNRDLSHIPVIMVILNSLIKSQTAALEGASAEGRQEMLIDRADRWDRVPGVIKMAPALNPRTKYLE